MKAWLAGLLLLAGCTDAQAAALPFTGTLTLQFGPVPAIVVPGAGIATVNGAGPRQRA